MNKLTKKDFLYNIINTIIFLIFIYILCENTYLYGSTLDWVSQHITIPDYFRTLFYQTKDLFPDFAFNLGSGQNIYNLSYYGFLSPIILISYLLPFIKMSTYIVISTIITCLISSYLIYLFLKKKNFQAETCFLSAFIFLMATSISFSSHRHIMFINYMPFLIMGLFGVDKKLDKGRSWLLILSTFLMIMTSYYFSIGGIICLFIYALYRYLNKMNIITIKTLIKNFIAIFIPILIAILISSILTLPTIATILNNRLPSNVTINIKDLLVPDLSFNNLLYNYYGLGLTAIIIPSLINLFKKNKANIILGILLIFLVLLNIFNYLINGTMYINSKSLIPLLPLYIYSISIFIEDLFNKKISSKLIIFLTIIMSIIISFNNKYYLLYIIDIILIIITIILYNKFNKKLLFILPLTIFLFITNLSFSKLDTLVLKEDYQSKESTIKDNINLITELDSDIYRISNNLSLSTTPNNIYNNLNYYNSTIYSSLSNNIYNNFYYCETFNNLPTRNRALTVSNQNVLFLMLTGNKYILSNQEIPLGYEQISSHNGLYIYRNQNVFPLGFATSSIMNYEEFYKLSDQVKQEALLNVIVTNSPSQNNFVSNTQKIDIDYQDIFTSASSLFKEEKDNSISLTTKDSLKVTYKIPKKYQNKIIFIRFKMNHSEKESDLVIKINNVKNKLTASNWKYYNNNEIFTYVLSSQNQKELNFIFQEGTYNLSDFETYILDYATIENLSSKLDRFIISKDTTKGDFINGEINVLEDGYFMLTIPYDSNFIIKVDNQITNYEKVDNAFIGFKIKAGYHKISIEYKAPLKDISLIISSFGLLISILVITLESHKQIN